MDDDRRMADFDRVALLAELVCDIEHRGEDDDAGILFVLLTSAWPTRLAQLS
jgi:hypothetical protein